MKKILKEQLLQTTNPENIYIINITDNIVKLLADIEYWESAPDSTVNINTDPYRIELFYTLNWILDNNILDNMKINNNTTLNTAIADIRGNISGGIGFLHEDNESRSKYSSVISQLCDLYKDQYNTILQLSNEEFADIYTYLKNGIYIIVISSQN